MPIIAFEQEVIAAAITIACILYLDTSDVHQHCMSSQSRAATLLEDTDFRSRSSTKHSRMEEVDPVVI